MCIFFCFQQLHRNCCFWLQYLSCLLGSFDFFLTGVIPLNGGSQCFRRSCEKVDWGRVFEHDEVYIQLLMSQLELFAHRDADGCEASSVLLTPSGFWLCCHRGCPLRAASNPGSTGWSGPSLVGLGWSGGPYTGRHSESRCWTAAEGGPDCLFPPTRCWPYDWKAPRAAVWRACVWSFSLWMCTGRCRRQTTAESGSEDLVLFLGCGPLSESGRRHSKGH